jgi:hypothetical protein
MASTPGLTSEPEVSAVFRETISASVEVGGYQVGIEQQSQHEALAVSGITRWGRIGFAGVAGLFLAALGLQVFLAGMSIFFDATWWQVHVTMASLIEWLPTVMIALAFVGRLPRAFALLSVLLLGLIMLQYVFVEVAAQSGVRWIAAFHPVNAVIMFTVGLMLLQKARRALG